MISKEEFACGVEKEIDILKKNELLKKQLNKINSHFLLGKYFFLFGIFIFNIIYFNKFNFLFIKN